MVSLRFTLISVSVLYCVSVLLMLLHLPSIQHHLSRLQIGPTTEAEFRPYIHPHIIHSRLAQERCANLSRRMHQTVDEGVVFSVIPDSKIFVMKAYHDRRLVGKPYIRLIVLMQSFLESHVNLHCHIPISLERMYTVPAVKYQFNENHGMVYGGFIFSCPLPPRLATDLPICMVRVTDGSSSMTKGVDLPLTDVPRGGEPLRSISICVPPLFGHLEPKRLIEFIEFNRILGVEHFYFYELNKERDNETQSVFNHYSALGLVTKTDWAIPVPLNTLWYKGQMLSIHHCLYANMGVSKYTAFQDLDEAFVPAKHANLLEVLRDIDKDEKHCGFRFFSAFFPQYDQGPLDLTSLRSWRTKMVSRIRTKCIVRPELIFEMGIHHISKQNIEEKTPKNIPEEVLLLHHYRECDGSFSMRCRPYVHDTNADQFAQKLATNVKAAVRVILTQ